MNAALMRRRQGRRFTLAAPVAAAASNGDGTADVTWTDVGATTYEVHRGPATAQDFTPSPATLVATVTGDVLTFTDTPA